MISKFKLVKNIIMNLIAIGMPMVVLQIFLLPNVSKTIGDNKYGLLLSSIGFITMLSTAFGSTLNNSRLLTNEEYIKNKISGDYNLYVLFFILINLVTNIIFFIISDYKFDLIELLILLCISSFILLNEYYYVYFRLRLDYSKVVKLNIMNVIGYIFGWILFTLTKKWLLIYLCGSLFSLVYTMFTNPLPKESFGITKLFRKSSNKIWILFIVTLTGMALNYVDRLVIFPIFGGKAVSIYYCATLIGKLGISVITPINNVILSFITNLKTFGKKKFIWLLLLTVIIGMFGYTLCILLSRPILTRLYPNYVDESMNYIYITTLSAVLIMIVSVLNPFVLKFCKTSLQLRINIIYIIIYFLSCFILVNFFGLLGMCLAYLISAVVKLLYTITIYLKNN